MRLLIHLKAKGLRETTLKPLGKRLERLARDVNLDDPEAVARYISEREWSPSYKHNVINAVAHFYSFHGIKWQRPYYRRIDRIRKVPREAQINKVIAYARARYSLCFSILRDTGLRPVELTWLRIQDVDLESGLLYPGTAKMGAGRVLKLRPSTLAMLKRYVQCHHMTQDDKLCHNEELLTLNWCRLRNSVSEKLGEPEIKQIRLYDLRHHYATLLYQKTKDIVHVQRQLGHRRITHTLRYIHLVDLDSEEYVIKVATNVEEATPLLEAGFTFVAVTPQDVMMFRKPK